MHMQGRLICDAQFMVFVNTNLAFLFSMNTNRRGDIVKTESLIDEMIQLAERGRDECRPTIHSFASLVSDFCVCQYFFFCVNPCC